MNPAAATLSLLMTSIVLAAACTLFCALDLRFHFQAFARRLSFLFGLLLVTQSSLIGVQVFAPHASFFGTGYQVLVLTAWGLLAAALIFNRYLFADFIGVLVCGADTTLLVSALLLRQPASTPVPGGGLPLLIYLHVAAIILSYVVMTLACISALAYLLRDRGLKDKRASLVLDSLPPLSTLQAFTHSFVLAGFVALSVGIILSQVWVVAAHRHSNFFDIRESWVLISWVLYAIYAVVRIVGRWEGRRLAFLVIAGYATSLAPAVALGSLGARA